MPQRLRTVLEVQVVALGGRQLPTLPALQETLEGVVAVPRREDALGDSPVSLVSATSSTILPSLDVRACRQASAQEIHVVPGQLESNGYGTTHSVLVVV